MSFIEIPLEGTNEETSVPENVYTLRVEAAQEMTNDETGRFSILCIINIEDPPAEVDNPAAVFHYLNIPNKKDDAKASKFMMLLNKRFLVAFGVPFEGNGFNPEDIPGSTAELLLTEDEYKGVIRNSIKLPQIDQ